MFGHRFKLLSLFGFEVAVDGSWLILAVLIAWSLAVGVFPHYDPGLTAATYWWMGVIGAGLLFASIIFHELCHSLVARRYGLPIRGITLFIFGGVSEMTDEPTNWRTEFLMAIAGPLSSIGLGFVFYVAYRVDQPVWPAAVTGVLAYLAWINWLLAGFNLVPAFPLDGGRVLRSLLWRSSGDIKRATRTAAAIGSVFGIALMVYSVFVLFSGNFIAAVWWFLIGMFLRRAARSSYQQVLVRSALQGESLERFMRRNPVTIRPETTVATLVEDYIYRYHFKMFPVVNDSGRLLGCVTTRDVRNVPRQDWNIRQVSDLLHRCDALNSISVRTDVMQALSTMSRTGKSRLLVIDDGRLAGIVSLKDLLGFLSVKLDLGDRNEEQMRPRRAA